MIYVYCLIDYILLGVRNNNVQKKRRRSVNLLTKIRLQQQQQLYALSTTSIISTLFLMKEEFHKGEEYHKGE